MGSASDSSGTVLEPAGIGSIRHGESFWKFLSEATHVLAPCCQNLAMKTQWARICSLMAEEDICKTSNYSTSHWLELALTYALLMLKFTYLLASTQFVQRYFLF